MPEYIIIMVAYLFDALRFGVARHRSVIALGLVAVAVATALVRVFLLDRHVSPVVGLVGAALTVVFTRWCAKWLREGGNALVVAVVSDLSGRFLWWAADTTGNGLRAALALVLPSPRAVVTEVHAVPCSCETCLGRVVPREGSLMASERDYLRRPGETPRETPAETPAYGPLRLVPQLAPAAGEAETYDDWLPHGAFLPFAEGVKIAARFGVPRSTFARHRSKIHAAA